MPLYTTRQAATAAAVAAGITNINVFPKLSGKVIKYGYEELHADATQPVVDMPQPQATEFVGPLQPKAPRTYNRPKTGVCADVWTWCDAHKPTTAKQVREHGETVGWNMNNCTTEYYLWRKAGMH